jgi:hypothetical protein
VATTGFPRPTCCSMDALGCTQRDLFAVTLAAKAGSRSLEDLSIRRTALWGALAALGLPVVVFGSVVVEQGLAALSPEYAVPPLGVAAALGTGLAAGTLALARRSTVSFPHAERGSDIRQAAT